MNTIVEEYTGVLSVILQGSHLESIGLLDITPWVGFCLVQNPLDLVSGVVGHVCLVDNGGYYQGNKLPKVTGQGRSGDIGFQHTCL